MLQEREAGAKLYACSEEASKVIALHRCSLDAAMGDLRGLNGFLSFAELEAEKDVLSSTFAQKGLKPCCSAFLIGNDHFTSSLLGDLDEAKLPFQTS